MVSNENFRKLLEIQRRMGYNKLNRVITEFLKIYEVDPFYLYVSAEDMEKIKAEEPSMVHFEHALKVKDDVWTPLQKQAVLEFD